MASIPVSLTAGSRLELVGDRWVLRLPTESHDIADASDPAFWPLLESNPADVLALLRAIDGPHLPLETVIESALRSGQPYWQELTISWIRALPVERSSAVGAAAADVVAMHHAGQRARQQLERWLAGKPWR